MSIIFISFYISFYFTRKDNGGIYTDLIKLADSAVQLTGLEIDHLTAVRGAVNCVYSSCGR